MGIEQRTNGLYGPLDNSNQFNGFAPQFDLAPHDVRDIQEIVHQPHQMLDLLLHDRHHFLFDPADSQEVQAATEWGQRVAEFVGQHRQELVLAAVRLPQLPIEAGVFDGDGGTAGKVFRHREVFRIVFSLLVDEMKLITPEVVPCASNATLRSDFGANWRRIPRCSSPGRVLRPLRR